MAPLWCGVPDVRVPGFVHSGHWTQHNTMTPWLMLNSCTRASRSTARRHVCCEKGSTSVRRSCALFWIQPDEFGSRTWSGTYSRPKTFCVSFSVCILFLSFLSKCVCVKWCNVASRLPASSLIQMRPRGSSAFQNVIFISRCLMCRTSRPRPSIHPSDCQFLLLLWAPGMHIDTRGSCF